MTNSLLYIPDSYRCLYPAFCNSFSDSGLFFGTLLVGFSLNFGGAKRMS
ncbi:hypothetical protein HV164_14025 [Citrobacter freundii]|uniref:Uncharacterized protein n=1 Tax=Citrobacter freundii TaxID=546 RepID=A0ABD7B0R5_CITFR|nr:hypothetical protein HV164_14025 [Citrobacter freundii]